MTPRHGATTPHRHGQPWQVQETIDLPLNILIMAKSKSFFGLRTGSTKNFTFSQLDGKQITKERVTSVKNPRSEGQMRQRMLMTTIGAAYKYLKAIADHSFEGKTYGQANMSEFMRVNLHKYKDSAKKGNAAIAFNAYQDGEINPLAYILSAGSLPDVPFTINAQNQIEISVEADSASTAEEVYSALGIRANDMLTFVWVDGKSSLKSGVYMYTPAVLNIVRLKANVAGTIASPHDAFTIESNHNGLDFNISLKGGKLVLASTDANFGGVILSRQQDSAWLRSNCVMACNKQITAGVTVASQFATYPVGADYILNGAEMNGDATTNTLPTPKITLSSKSVSITANKGTANAPTISGNDAGGKVTYSSSAPNIAQVNADTGLITANGNGTAVISVHVAATQTTGPATVTFNVVVTGQTSGSGPDDGGVE